MPLPSRETLEALAVRAGALALQHFRHVAPERKADRTLVTRADREVEALLVGEIAKLVPDAAILGEEGTARTGTSPYRFVLDPIDGTAAFVAGLPTWCICIGILAGDEAVAGVVHVPCAAETYAAIDGVAWWNGVRLPSLAEAQSGEGDRFIVSHAKAHLRYQLRYPGKVRALGSTAYHVALVARGAAEAAIAGRAHIWDLVAPGAVLAAVGGRLVYGSGEPVRLGPLADGSRAPADIVAGAPDRLRELLPLLGVPA
jgi:myo-inositol-1(or 4)-monophosphatase